MSTPCACNPSKEYEQCCGRFHSGSEHAATAEELMRSRYSAYALGEIDYLAKTLPLMKRKGFDRDGAKEWSKNSTWKGLEIISSKTSSDNKSATVEFKASFEYRGEDQVHHERATFKREHDRWFFIDGRVL